MKRNIFVSIFIYALLCISSIGNAQIACNQSQVNITCGGNNNGAANVEPTGGVAPYDYSWSHNAGLNAPMAFPISAGNYTVTITDSAGSSTTCDFVLEAPDLIEINNIEETNPSCGLDNGILEIFATPKDSDPNSTNLMYSIDGGQTFQESNLFTGLPAADYLVIVLDGDFCFASESPQLVGTPPLEFVIVPECDIAGGNINVDLTVTGGTPDYDYNWEGPGGTYITRNLVNVPQGTYNLTVTDRVGCENYGSVSLSNCCSGMSFCAADVSHSGCAGENTGSIVMDPSGGLSPYEYTWSHDSSLMGNTANNLGAGLYMVTIVDANGCESICDYTITETGADIIENIIINNASCGLADGSIEIIASSPGTGSGTCDLQYSFDGGLSFGDDNTLNTLTSGNYDLVVSCGQCSESATVLVGSTSGVHIMSINPYCIMDGSISIDVNITMGTPPFSFSWLGPDGFSSSEEDLMGVPPGEYFLNVQDANGCEASASTSLYTPSIDDVEVEGFTCAGNDGEINIIADYPSTGSGSCDLAYSINGGADYQASPTFKNLNPGTFNISVRGCENCVAETEITVDYPYCVGSVGDFVWNDVDGDGIQDPGEMGIPNVRVELRDCFGVLIAVRYTDGSGFYEFETVNAGEYYVQFYFDSDYLVSEANQGGNDNLDSDVGDFNGPNTTQKFNVQADENVDNVDLGLYNCVKIGESVWFDTNGNDIQDDNENGINGLKVLLYRWIDGDAILWDYTYTSHKPGTASDDGYYQFCVPPGNYYINFDMTIPSLVRVVPHVGSEATDSDIDGSNGQGTTGTFSVTAGNDRLDIGAGYYGQATLGDRVWVDQNNDGIRDLNEPRMGGVKVQAFNVNSQRLIRTTFTNANGEYVIDDLAKDNYYIKVTPPSGYTFTSANVGDEETDSDIDHSNGANTTKIISTEPGEHLPNIDAGLRFTVLPLALSHFNGEHVDGVNKISWSILDESNLSNYQLLRMDEWSGTFEIIAEMNANQVTNYSYNDDEIEANAGYYYQLNALDNNQESTLSEIIYVKTPSLENVENDLIFTMYPNPASSYVILNVDTETIEGAYEVSLSNAAGKQMAIQSISTGNQVHIDLAHLIPGVYQMTLTSGTKTGTKKLIHIK